MKNGAKFVGESKRWFSKKTGGAMVGQVFDLHGFSYSGKWNCWRDKDSGTKYFVEIEKKLLFNRQAGEMFATEFLNEKWIQRLSVTQLLKKNLEKCLENQKQKEMMNKKDFARRMSVFDKKIEIDKKNVEITNRAKFKKMKKELRTSELQWEIQLKKMDVEMGKMRSTLLMNEIQRRGDLTKVMKVKNDLQMIVLEQKIELKKKDFALLKMKRYHQNGNPKIIELKKKDVEVANMNFELGKSCAEKAKMIFELKNKDAEIARMFLELKTKDEEVREMIVVVQSKDQELEKKMKTIKSKDNEIRKKDVHMAKMNLELRKMDAEKAELHFEVSRRNAEIGRMKLELKKKNIEIEMNPQLLKMNAEIRKKDSELQQSIVVGLTKDRDLQGKENTIRCKDEELRKMNRKMDFALQKKDQVIQEKSGILKTKIDELRKKDVLIKEKNNELHENWDTIKRKDGELKKKDGQIEKKNNEIRKNRDTIKRNKLQLSRKLAEMDIEILKMNHKVNNKDAEIGRMKLKFQEQVQRIDKKDLKIRRIQDSIRIKDEELVNIQVKMDGINLVLLEKVSEIEKQNVELLKNKETIRTIMSTCLKLKECIGDLKKKFGLKELKLHKKTSELRRSLEENDEIVLARRMQLHIQFHDVDSKLLTYDTLIGSGSVCDVHKYVLNFQAASGETFKKSVALKVFKKGLQIDVTDKMVVEETERMISTNHPNIVQCFGCHVKSLKGIFMEECSQSLGAIIKADNLPKFEGKVSIAKQIANGMHYLHVKKRMIHRDLKPDNVLLLNGICKIVDFGLSKEICNLKTSLNLSSGAAGTPFYWAPEMFKMKGENYNCSCDVFSFGVTCYVLYFEKSSIGDLQKLLYGGYSLTYEQSEITELLQKETWKPKYPDEFMVSRCTKKEISFLRMIEKCYSINPQKRPTFKEILEQISSEIE